MVVTTSTASCVSARSGAENQTKVRLVAKPAPPSISRAARRWNLACVAAPMAQAMPTTQISTKSQPSGTRGRLPQLRPEDHSEAVMAAMPTSTSSSICGCSRRVYSVRWTRRAPWASRARTPSKIRWPSKRPNSGMRFQRLSRSGLRNRNQMAVPPLMAIRLMISGAFTPCHSDRL